VKKDYKFVASDSDIVMQVAASDDETRNFPVQNTSSPEQKCGKFFICPTNAHKLY
jgi:hypothetical protein